MQCDAVIFSEHAFSRMAERDIKPSEVEKAIKAGKIIKEYPDDEPNPSFLLLGYANDRRSMWLFRGIMRRIFAS